MNLTAADIDRIVAEVVRRLRAMTAGSSMDRGRESLAKSDSANGHDITRQRLPTPSVSELQLSERLITLQSLKGRLEGVTKIVVGDRAVITPAVKDELKQRGISWERGERGRESLAKNDFTIGQDSARQRLPTPASLQARS